MSRQFFKAAGFCMNLIVIIAIWRGLHEVAAGFAIAGAIYYHGGNA